MENVLGEVIVCFSHFLADKGVQTGSAVLEIVNRVFCSIEGSWHSGSQNNDEHENHEKGEQMRPNIGSLIVHHEYGFQNDACVLSDYFKQIQKTLQNKYCNVVSTQTVNVLYPIVDQ